MAVSEYGQVILHNYFLVYLNTFWLCFVISFCKSLTLKTYFGPPSCIALKYIMSIYWEVKKRLVDINNTS